MKIRKQKGITLIALVITIILLLILAGVVLNLALGQKGIINYGEVAGKKTNKETATEKINLKITKAQMNKYAEQQRMPTLQELADSFCEDNEIEYVELASKKTSSLKKIQINENKSFFTKLKEYPYEFEINSSLQLASIDGIKLAKEDTITITQAEYDKLKNANIYSAQETLIGTWINGKPLYRRVLPAGSMNGSGNAILLTPYNIEEVTYLYGRMNISNGSTTGDRVWGTGPAPHAASAHAYHGFYYNAEAHAIWSWGGGDVVEYDYIVIEYTKTTDTAN